MHDFPPNINWRLVTLLATFLGFALEADYTAREQIAIGNFIIQIGQTLLTNATYQQLIETRITGDEKINLNSREFKCGGSPFISSSPIPNDFKEFYKAFKSEITDEELTNLHSAIQKLNEELNKIREELNK